MGGMDSNTWLMFYWLPGWVGSKIARNRCPTLKLLPMQLFCFYESTVLFQGGWIPCKGWPPKCWSYALKLERGLWSCSLKRYGYVIESSHPSTSQGTCPPDTLHTLVNFQVQSSSSCLACEGMAAMQVQEAGDGELIQKRELLKRIEGDANDAPLEGKGMTDVPWWNRLILHLLAVVFLWPILLALCGHSVGHVLPHIYS